MRLVIDAQIPKGKICLPRSSIDLLFDGFETDPRHVHLRGIENWFERDLFIEGYGDYEGEVFISPEDAASMFLSSGDDVLVEYPVVPRAASMVVKASSNFDFEGFQQRIAQRCPVVKAGETIDGVQILSLKDTDGKEIALSSTINIDISLEVVSDPPPEESSDEEEAESGFKVFGGKGYSLRS